MIDLIVPGRATFIVGGQFGSEAKGLAAGIVSHLGDGCDYLICTTNAGAQAGHTTVLDDGTKFVCYHLPTIGVLRTDARIYINAGAIIDVELLVHEVDTIAAALEMDSDDLWNRITIHPAAAIITPEAREAEGVHSTGKTGSTMKGVGAALCNKIMRKAGSVAGSIPQLAGIIDTIDLNEAMDNGAAVTVEIPQGTGLSINGGFWPACTSRECWLGQGMTDAGIHPKYVGATVMVVRTMPIRVGHVYGPSAPGLRDYVKLGDSGPFYPDSQELSWEQDLPGIEPERTTVTKRVRRIASFSELQYEEALRLNRPDVVLLTFTNYLELPRLEDLIEGMRSVEREVGVHVQHLYSWGPKIGQFSASAADASLHCKEPINVA